MFRSEPWIYLLGYTATEQLRDLDCLQNKTAAVRLVMGVTTLRGIRSHVSAPLCVQDFYPTFPAIIDTIVYIR